MLEHLWKINLKGFQYKTEKKASNLIFNIQTLQQIDKTGHGKEHSMIMLGIAKSFVEVAAPHRNTSEKKYMYKQKKNQHLIKNKY